MYICEGGLIYIYKKLCVCWYGKILANSLEYIKYKLVKLFVVIGCAGQMDVLHMCLFKLYQPT